VSSPAQWKDVVLFALAVIIGLILISIARGVL